MKKTVFLILAIASLAIGTYAGNEVITNFKDPTISCDYLVIAPFGYQSVAVALAQHRNSFKNDDVEFAKVANLDDIIAAFPGTDFKHRNVALWKGLKWAKENWKVSFRYLVLIGSDAYAAIVDTLNPSYYGSGLMPTWYDPSAYSAATGRNNFPVNVTDDCYAKLSGENPPSDFASGTLDSGICIGRIPASTSTQCSLYVEKVKRFDLSSPKGEWRNNILAIADDGMQGPASDPLGAYHQQSAEAVIDANLQGYSVQKQYLSAYPQDEFYEKPTAKTAVIASINRGVMWAFFFGHGNDQILTDENVLNTENSDRFTNDSMPFVFVSLTSMNGSFVSFAVPIPMGMKYLFKAQGGALAYIASTNYTYASDNEKLANAFFSDVNINPAGSIGGFLQKAKITANDRNSSCYFLLGDPAIRVNNCSTTLTVKAIPDSAPTTLRISVPDNVSFQMNYSINFTVRDTVIQDPSAGPEYLEFSYDSTILTGTGVFQHSIDVPFPHAAQFAQKAIVYVWNDSVSSRGETGLAANSSGIINRLRQNAAFPHALLKIDKAGLMVFGIPTGLYSICIYNVMGKVVYSGEHQQRAGGISIVFQGKVLSSGRYFMRIRNGKTEAMLPFMHVTGR
jgi:hypothetical protein